MKRTLRLLQIVGWILAAAGGLAATKTWLDLRHEQRLHAFETLPLDLTAASDWKEVRVTPGRPGPWRISLTTVNAFSRPDSVEAAPYNGALEVQVLDSAQAVRWTKVLDGPSSGHTKPPNMAWTELGAVDLSEARESVVRARVLRGDPAFERTVSEIRAFPPQVHDMSWYPFGQTVKIVLWGLASLVGLGLVISSALLDRR